jgi:hypothetical protein
LLQLWSVNLFLPDRTPYQQVGRRFAVLYVLAMLASPIAVWMCRQPTHAAANLVLWVVAIPSFLVSGIVALLLIPVIDALFVVNDYYAEQHSDQLVRLQHSGQLGIRRH